jgi:hypothetical protein
MYGAPSIFPRIAANSASRAAIRSGVRKAIEDV